MPGNGLFRWGKSSPNPPERPKAPETAGPSGNSSSLAPPRLSAYHFEPSPPSNYAPDNADYDDTAQNQYANAYIPDYYTNALPPAPIAPTNLQEQEPLPVRDARSAVTTPATTPKATYKAFPSSPGPPVTASPRPPYLAPEVTSPGVITLTSPDGRRLLESQGVITPVARKPISSIPVSTKPSSSNPVSASPRPSSSRPSSSRPLTPKIQHPLPPLPPPPTFQSEHAGSSEVYELEARDDAEYQAEIAPPVEHLAPPLNPDIDPSSTPMKLAPKPPNAAAKSLRFESTLGPESISSNSLMPPVPIDPLRSPRPDLMDPESPSEDKSWILEEVVPATPARQERPQTEHVSHYDTKRPTCSINLVCYRSGARGCSRKQIQCVLRSRFPDDESFEKMISSNAQLIQTDVEFFEEARRLFEQEMCDFFRRWFSLKSLRAFRVLSYTPTTRPVVVPVDDFVLQEMMYAYHNPGRLSSDNDWVKWVFRLRRQDKRHAIEFVEGWNSTRIGIAGSIPWLSSCIVGIAWTAAGGDVQSAFTVASFILTSSSIILALLAIISSIESSGGSGL